MSRFAAALFFATVITCWLQPPTSLAAGEPSYLILRAPTRSHKHVPHYPGRGYEARTQTYNYGWFGAQPRRHKRHSSGYYSSYIQWSKQ